MYTLDQIQYQNQLAAEARRAAELRKAQKMPESHVDTLNRDHQQFTSRNRAVAKDLAVDRALRELDYALSEIPPARIDELTLILRRHGDRLGFKVAR
jgi:hypothetical protein